MSSKLQKALRGALRALRHRIRRATGSGPALLRRRFPDLDDAALACSEYVKPYTLTSPERIFALRQAVQYVVNCAIPGDIVECGVWRGGSIMAVARTLLEMQALRRLHLFDTFQGLPPPADVDRDYRGRSAAEQMADMRSFCPLDEVKRNLCATGYDEGHMVFVKGKVEDTIPAQAPAQISLLRLDTDWYESTYHELLHLYPRLSVGGVLIIDDYGHWQGARRAVDQYIQQNHLKLLLQRIDFTGRICVKLEAGPAKP
jgi:hypothetical protein